jgi:hypothetical protein
MNFPISEITMITHSKRQNVGNSYLALVASVIDETRTQIVQRVRPGAIVGPARYFFCFFIFSCL